jgi:hypothetical protein
MNRAIQRVVGARREHVVARIEQRGQAAVDTVSPTPEADEDAS